MSRTQSLVVNQTETAEMIGVSSHVLRQMVKDGRFPPPRKMRGPSKKWLREDVVSWLRSRPLEESPGHQRAVKEDRQADLVSDKYELWKITQRKLWRESVSADESICGVYFLFDGGDVVYVGQSVAVRSRIQAHVANDDKSFDRWAVLPCDPDDRLAIERYFIRRFEPTLNRTSR